MLLIDPPLFLVSTCSERSPSFLQSEVAKSQLPPTNPAKLCTNLYSPNPQQLLFNSDAKTVVDLVVQEDPCYEYQRAVNALM